MKITVQYTTQLRAALGESEQVIEVADNTTLHQLVEVLARDHADAFRQFVWDDHQHFLPNLIFCVGDQQVAAPESHLLRDGDTVTFLSAISGG